VILFALYLLVGYSEKAKIQLSKIQERALKWASIIVACLVIVGSFAALYIAASYLQDDTGIIKGVSVRYFYPAYFLLAIIPFSRNFTVPKESLYARVAIWGSILVMFAMLIHLATYYQWLYI
jgi:hypothetical protein